MLQRAFLALAIAWSFIALAELTDYVFDQIGKPESPKPKHRNRNPCGQKPESSNSDRSQRTESSEKTEE